jgi:hypothetical protein
VSLGNARRMLQWDAVVDALESAGTDKEAIELVLKARAVSDVVYMMTDVLTGNADANQARNYVKVDMVGLLPPFDRAYVELVRPGGKTSHELREMLRARLIGIRGLLAEGQPHRWTIEGMIQGIDEDLTKETP